MSAVLGPRLPAKLVLTSKPCNVFGDDIKVLDLAVVYETGTRIHLKITDASSERYEVPQVPQVRSLGPRGTECTQMHWQRKSNSHMRRSRRDQ